MHKSASIVVLAALALASAGCKKSDTAADTTLATPTDTVAVATEAAPIATATPGDYDVSSTDGKALSTTTINADGTYRDVPKKGLPVAGLVKFTGGKTCFDPSGKTGATCWTDSAPASDGSFTATSDKGEVVKVTPKAK